MTANHWSEQVLAHAGTALCVLDERIECKVQRRCVRAVGPGDYEKNDGVFTRHHRRPFPRNFGFPPPYDLEMIL